MHQAMNDLDNEKGFEALLKPIQDVIAKDWKLRLKNYLDKYLNYLHKIGIINFSEAALIVQNTSNYYSRRVDLMYNWVRQFCINLSKNENMPEDSQGEGRTEGNHPRNTKKKSDGLLSDELERYDCSSTANLQRVPFRTFSVDDAKLTLLNTNTRAPAKSGTTCAVYQLNNDEMGYKEEFRMCIKLLNNGMLYPEIVQRNKLIDNDAVEDDVEEGLSEIFEDIREADSVELENRMDIEGLPPPPTECTGISDLPDPPADLSDHNNDETPEEQPRLIAYQDPFQKVIPFATFIIHRKFKKSKVFSLPKDLIKEGKEIRNKNKSNSKDQKETFNLSFSELLGGKSEDMISHRLRKRQSERLKIINANRKVHKNIENAPEVNIDHVDDRDDCDDTLADLMDDDHNLPQNANSSFDPGQSLIIEKTIEDTCRLAKMNRKRDDILTSQKRVADWHVVIGPHLDEAEKRLAFDVQEYCTRILSKFTKLGETLLLKQIIDTDDYKEVCRYIMSALQLANNYNVDITKTDDNELSTDNIQLTLLSLTRHHEELDANIGEAAAGTH